MREIKFRGRCRETGEWVYGDLVHKAITNNNKIALVGIAPHGCYAVDVDINTVGEFTGLTDLNGKKIYEGDIIWSGHDYWDGCSGLVMSVVFEDGCFEFRDKKYDWVARWDDVGQDKTYLIGNIYENPELLEVNND